ncbi:MAG: hypothetical protein ACYS8W_10280, partial [Planctomycetota bacterium]
MNYISLTARNNPARLRCANKPLFRAGVFLPAFIALIIFSTPAFAINAPSGFRCSDCTSKTLTWAWNNVAGESGYEIHDGSDVYKGETVTNELSFQETGFNENTTRTRHCHAFTAGTAEIGNQTVSQYYPIDSCWNFVRVQMLYLQSEINQAGYITHLRFYQSMAAPVPIYNTTIYLFQTSSTQLSTWVGGVSGAGTLVYSGNLTLGDTVGWYEIKLDTPFYYSNAQNLLVSLRLQDRSFENNLYPRWYCSNLDNRCLYGVDDLINPPAVSLNSYLPNIQFEIRNFSAASSPAAGTTAKMLRCTGFTSSSLTWTWDDETYEDIYQIFNGITSAMVINNIPANSTSTTADSGLSPNATYYRFIRSVDYGPENCAAQYTCRSYTDPLAIKHSGEWRAGKWSDGSSIMGGFVEFDLSRFSPYTTVTAARFFGCCVAVTNWDQNVNIDIKKIDIDTRGATWDELMDELINNSTLTLYDDSTMGWTAGPFAQSLYGAAAKSWIEGEIAGGTGYCTLGIVDTTIVNGSNYCRFYEWYYADPAFRPYLEVSFTSYSGNSMTVSACTLANVPTMANNSGTFPGRTTSSINVQVGAGGNPANTPIELYSAKGNTSGPTETFISRGILTSGYAWNVAGLDQGSSYWFKARARNWPGYWSNNCSLTVWSTDGTAVADNAQYISQSVPTAMVCGKTYSVDITMKNVGSATWLDSGLWRLGSQNTPTDLWVTGRVNVTTDVVTGQSYMFTFNVTAPATPGDYDFRWRMVHEGVVWFGDFTPTVTITCIDLDTPGTFSGSSSASNSITWSWTDNSDNETNFQVLASGGGVVATVGAGVLNTPESGLSENTQYTRLVRAYSSAYSLYGDNSSTDSVYTLCNPPTDGEVTIGTVIATTATAMTVGVTVCPNSTFGCTAADFITPGGPGANNSGWVTDIQTGNFIHTDSGLTPNTTYEWRARYRNGDGIATNYNTTLKPKCTLAAVPTMTNSGATFSQTEYSISATVGAAGNPGGTIIELFYSTSSSGPFTSEGTKTSGYVWDVTGLVSDTSYWFIARSQNWAGIWSGNCSLTVWSTDISFLNSPSGFGLLGCSSSTLTWGWTDNSPDEEGFQLLNQANGA